MKKILYLILGLLIPYLSSAQCTITCKATTPTINLTGSSLLTNANVFADISGSGCSFSPASVLVDCDTETVTLMASDGTEQTCSVNIVDTDTPSIICQDIEVTITGNNIQVDATELVSSVTDNCGVDINDAVFQTGPSSTAPSLTFDCGDAGDNSVTLEIADESGNVSTCTQNVNVSFFTCQDITVDLNSSGNVTVNTSQLITNRANCVFNFTDADFTSTGDSEISFDCDDLGDNTVTLSLNAGGATDECTQTITVEDNTAPNIQCVNNSTTIPLDSDGEIKPEVLDNGSTDNCGMVTFSTDIMLDCDDAGNQVVVTLTADDGNGNTSQCTRTIEVVDNIAPTMNCRSNVNVELMDNGVVEINDPQAVLDNGTTDNCTSTDNLIFTATPNFFDCSNINSSRTVQLTVTDESNNQGICSVSVTAVDKGNPIARCKTGFPLVLDGNSSASINISDLNNGSFDACTAVSLSASQTEFDCSDIGDTEVTLMVTDQFGNSSQCSTTFNVSENIPPVADCKSSVRIFIGSDGTATLTPEILNRNSTDNCGAMGLNFSVSKSIFTCADIGTVNNQITLTVTDGSGNTDQCTGFVNVAISETPTAVCEDVTVELDQSGNATLLPSQVNGTINDCGLSELSLSQDRFDCSDLGNNMVTLQVNGSVSSDQCTANVNVVDNLSPNVLCKASFTVGLSGGTATITPENLDNGSTDNCDAVTLTASQTTFDCDDAGMVPVTLTGRDASGNEASCITTVIVVDTEAPTVNCVTTPVELTLSGTNSIIRINPDDLDGGSTDNCDNLELTTTPVNLNCSNIGSNTVTLIATDVSNNTSTCTATVILTDNTTPVADCESITVQLDETGSITVDGSLLGGNSVDNCISNATFTLNQNIFDCSDIGAPIPVELTVTDPSNNSDTDDTDCTITVVDATRPTARCKTSAVQVFLDETGMATLDPASLDNGSTDNCTTTGDLNFTASPSTFDCESEGSTFSVTLTVTDNSGNSRNCLGQVRVVDDRPPMAVCNDITISLNQNGEKILAGSELNNGSTDNCGISNLRTSPNFFTCSDIGAPVPTTLTVTDVNGNVAEVQCNVTIIDDLPPVPVCLDVSVEFFGGQASITAEQVDGGSTDNCEIQSISVSPEDFTLDNSGQNTYTLTVTDIYDNVATCNGTVTVGDVVDPKAFCKNATIFLDNNGEVTLEPETVDDLSFDRNGIAERSVSPDMFNCDDVGINVYTLTVKDPSNNEASCQGLIEVKDTTAPIANCSDPDITLDVISGTFAITPDVLDDNSTDNCSIANRTVDVPMVGCDDLGENMITLTLTDVNGNSSSCISTVTVMDETSPSASCQDITIQLNEDGAVNIEGEDLDNGSFDNCTPIFSLSQSVFDCNNVGNNLVTLTVSDEAGNSSTDMCNLTVEDDIAPNMICANPTVELNDDGTVTITPDEVDGGSSDACGIADKSIDIDAFGCDNTGLNTVTLTVTDNNGNVNTCESSVNIVDVTNPVAICQDITVELDANGMVSITEDQIDDGSDDACGVTLELFPYEFDCSNVGPNRVQLKVTDPSGNSSSCFAHVEVQDNIEATPLCTDITIQLDGNGKSTIVVDDIDNGSFDNCGIKNRTVSQTTFDCENVGENIVTLQLTDVNDNTSSCTAIVTVEDDIVPIAVCRDLTIEVDEGTGMAAITPIMINGGSNTNCRRQELMFSLDITSFDCSNVGENTVVMTVTDVNGNSSNCNSTITITDETAPEAVCQDITAQLDETGNVTITPDDVDGGSFDACGIDEKMIDKEAFTCDDVGENTVILTVTDPSDNSSSCLAEVVVEDNVAPEALCNDVTVQLDEEGEGSTTVDELDGGSNDACGIASIQADQLEFGCDDVGDNDITLTVTDVNGNTSTCTSVVTVEDNVAPEAICQDITVELDAMGFKRIYPEDVDGGSNDACGIASLELDIDEFGCDEVGDNEVTLSVTDNNGNSSSCMSTVTVEDNTPPLAICRDITAELDENGEVTILPEDLDGGSMDACGIGGFAASQTEFDCSEVGDNEVILTVTDVNGNSATCTSIVTVEDNIPPTPVCQDITFEPTYLPASIFVDDIDGGSFDNCEVATVVINGAEEVSFSCDDLGENIVTLTVTDVNGNIASCDATVTLIENMDLPDEYQSVSVGESIGEGSFRSCNGEGGQFTVTSDKTGPFFPLYQDWLEFLHRFSDQDFEFRARVQSQDPDCIAGIMIRDEDIFPGPVGYVAFNTVDRNPIK